MSWGKLRHTQIVHLYCYSMFYVRNKFSNLQMDFIIFFTFLFIKSALGSNRI